MSSHSQLRFASALSTHADLGRAVDEVCRQALGQLQAPVQLAVLFVSTSHAPPDDGLAERACQRLGTDMLLGTTGESIAGTGQEIEGQPAVSLWLAHMEGVQPGPDALAAGTHSGWCEHRGLAGRFGRGLAQSCDDADAG